jgi:hypothetical protein
MANFNDTQAQAAYTAIDCIMKTTEDDDPSIGVIDMSFILENELYSIQYTEADLPMSSTPLEIKNYFIQDLKDNHEYLGPVSGTTETEVEKV